MKTYIIAEIGQAHDGSLGILHSYIDALSKCGVNAIKFQTHIADAESSFYEPFRIKFSYADKTRYDYWKRMELSFEQWTNIKLHCEKVGVEFLSSPFSIAAVKLLDRLNVKKIKIGSGEVMNFFMLDNICKLQKEIILSTGLSSLNEIDRAVDFIKCRNNPLSILQCTTKYPTKAEDVGLNLITKFKERYDVDTGLSDHSGSIFPSLAAVSIGAKILEFHAVFDKQMFGPDSSSSLTINEITELIKGVRFIEKMLVNPINKLSSNDSSDCKNIFSKSLAVNKDLPKGHILSYNDLETKKPSNMGIAPEYYQDVIGKKLNKKLNKWDFLSNDDTI